MAFCGFRDFCVTKITFQCQHLFCERRSHDDTQEHGFPALRLSTGGN